MWKHYIPISLFYSHPPALIRIFAFQNIKTTTMAAVYTDSNFDAEVIKTEKLSVVDFWAPWCGPCLALGPTIDALSKEYDGKINVGKVNVDENPNLSINYGVTSIPCVLFIKNGQVVDKQVGAAPKNVFDKKIQKILGV
jgi:thioredoxin 1